MPRFTVGNITQKPDWMSGNGPTSQEVWWYKNEKSQITTDGLKQADTYTVRIPDTSVEIKKDDYLVKGDCKVDMQTIKDLDGLDKTRITSANYNTFGGNPHIKVVGV